MMPSNAEYYWAPFYYQVVDGAVRVWDGTKWVASAFEEPATLLSDPETQRLKCGKLHQQSNRSPAF